MSIYRRALGKNFARLHPRIQERFDLDSTRGVASIGKGIMDDVWHGAVYTLPFLYIGTWRSIMFPEAGRNIPFRIYNYPYRDTFGRETVTWFRRFRMSRVREFAATMIYSDQRGRIVDYLGTHQHLAVDIDLSVSERGGLKLRSGEQRFHEGPMSFRFPMLFSGYADVEEWHDDQLDCFRIEVFVRNRIWGPLFGYKGRFRTESVPFRRHEIPRRALPVREERRE